MINTGWFKLVIHLSINLVIYDLCNIYTQLMVCNMKPSDLDGFILQTINWV